MNNSDMMGIGQLLGSVMAQSQTNFNGLVQLAEADTNFQKEVYKQFKQVNDKLDKILKGINKDEPIVPEEIETSSNGKSNNKNK